MKINIFVLVLLIFGYTNVYAAPSISSTSGTFNHLSSVTVSGSGFGTKSTVAPALFDKVEGTWAGLNNGDAIPDGGAIWSGNNESYYNTTVGEQRGGLSTANYKGTASVKNSVNGFTIPGRPSKSYISWWEKSSEVDNGGSKYLRFGDSAFDVGGDYQWDWGNVGTYIYFGGYCYINNDRYPVETYPDGYAIAYHTAHISANNWHFHELFIDSTAQTWEAFVDGVDSFGGITTWRSTTSACGDAIIDKIIMVGVDGNELCTAQDSWFDDIYADGTYQRVMICSGATWATRGTCEIQIPYTTWGDASLQITVNQGAFADSSTQYLYVVDSAGDANASGYEITFGAGESDTTAPSTTISTSDPSAITNGSLTVEGTASDAVGVTGCKWRLSAAPDGSNGTACTGTTSFSCATSGYASGANTMYVGCYDAAGNYGSDSITVNYTPPTTTITEVTFAGSLIWQ